MVTVYCDESGFSGPNLYHSTDTYFTYAGVAIEPAEALEVIEAIERRLHRFQGEVKFPKLAEREDGVAAIDWLLAEYGECAKVWFANKKFATAGKFFEYVFEPVLSENSLLFYANDFHRFIANMLYAGIESREVQADEMLVRFQQAIRAADAGRLIELLTGGKDNSSPGSPFEEMADFALGYRDKIIEEVRFIGSNDDLQRWTMDLTMSAFCMVARAHAQKCASLTIVCDDSKPIKAGLDTATAIVQADLSSVVGPLGWSCGASAKLNQPIRFVKASRDEPGIQIADLFAGIARRVITPPGDDLSDRWHHRLWNAIILPNSIEFDLSYANANEPQPFVNACVLRELAHRARNGRDPLAGMESFYHHLKLQRRGWKRFRAPGIAGSGLLWDPGMA